MLLWALKYLSMGLSVIPLKSRSKEPLIDWKEFQTRKANEAEICEWFRKCPLANLGIVSGSVSGVAIIDLDGQEGIATASRIGLTSPVMALTGNGKHLWYRNPKDIVLNAVRIYPGVDVRGEGGYVVAPPSIHENGRRYRWLNSFAKNLKNSLPPFPVLIGPMENVLKNTVTFTKNKERSSGNSRDSRHESGWIAKALEEMKDGNIDNTLTSVLGRLRADNWSSSDALVLLRPHADKAGATPGHLEEKIENIWNRYEPNQKNTSTGSRIFSDIPSTGFVIHAPNNQDSYDQFKHRSIQLCSGPETIRTGYSKLDQMLKGGLKSSRLFTLAARTGVGKTNWIIGAAREICRSGKSVLLFSTEMPYEEIWERYIATLNDPEAFRQHQFNVCDSFAPSLERVEDAVKEVKPDVFIFDHINHVSEEQRELGAFMQGLNFLHRKYECAGIVTAQLNRLADWVDPKTGEKVTPRMSMIKGSGTIEQASSRVLLLSETKATPEMIEIVGNLDKNDNGPKGLLHFGMMQSPYRMVEL